MTDAEGGLPGAPHRPRPSSFILPPSSFDYAAIAPPPGRLVVTLVAAGPFCLRSLNQNAVNQTCAPGATVLGKATSIRVREVIPSNFQPSSAVGGTAPTKL